MNYKNEAGVYARPESRDQFGSSHRSALKKKVFCTTFFDAGVFSFEEKKMAIQHRWVNDENNEAHAYS